MIKTKIFYCCLILFVGFACDHNTVFDNFKNIENQGWNFKDTIAFDVDITDSISKNDIYINLRNTNEYSFRNLNLISNSYFANEKLFTDTISLKMVDDFGNFNGKGLYLLENNLLIKNNYSFPSKGKYRFEFYHYMIEKESKKQIQTLQGISDIGLRIEKNR